MSHWFRKACRHMDLRVTFLWFRFLAARVVPGDKFTERSNRKRRQKDANIRAMNTNIHCEHDPSSNSIELVGRIVRIKDVI